MAQINKEIIVEISVFGIAKTEHVQIRNDNICFMFNCLV